MAKNTHQKISLKALSQSNIFVLSTIFGLSIAIISAITFSFISSLTSPVSAENGTASDSTDVTLSLLDSISIRTLDSARTTEIESLDMELTPTPSGRFIKDTTVVDVSTSNPSGYMLYMSSEYTDPRTSSPSTPVYTTDMINHDTNINDTVANLTNTNVSEAAFSAANTITSGTNSNPNINHWGYSLTENNVAGTYNPIPAYNASQTIRNDVVSAVEHSYTPVTVGVNVDTNIASGTYTNNLVFSTIVNPPYVDYSLLFNANTDGAGGDDGSVSNLPTDITERVMATSYTVTIPSTAPERANYVFTGYNTKADGTGTTYQPGDTYTLVVDDRQSAQTETAEETLYAIWNQYTYTVTYNCNGGTNCPANHTHATGDTTYNYTIPSTEPTKADYSFTGYLGSDSNTYQAGDTVTMTNGSSNSITLTAQWAKDFWTITYMQEMTPEICASIKTPSNAIGTNANAVVLDTDGISTVSGAKATYTVRNMAEYNNLVTAANQPYVAQRTLYDIRGANGTGTSANPVLSKTTNAKAYTVRKLADGNCWMTENLVFPLAAGVTVEAAYNTSATPYSFTPRSCATNNACSINSDTLAANGTYYYNWYAVTAETGTTSTASGSEASASICPIGWRIPADYSINPNKSYGSLTNAYGATTNGANNSQNKVSVLTAFPLNLVRLGYYNNSGVLSEYNAWARYWSSTSSGYSNNTTVAYDLLFGNSATHPVGMSARHSGLTARCVAL